MKILVTKKVEDKLSRLEERYKASFNKFVNLIKGFDDQQLIDYLNSTTKVVSSGAKIGEMRVYKIGDLRIFLSFTSDREGNRVLLLIDLVLRAALSSYSRDPRYNTQINPRYNTQINPRYNTQINPRYNTQINPRYNTQINPRYNTQINPRYNANFKGYYYYDINSVPLEFIISTNNNNILLFFDFNSEFIRYGIKHNNNGYVIFDVDNDWIGHIESDSQNGFNYFNLENKWIGFIK